MTDPSRTANPRRVRALARIAIALGCAVVLALTGCTEAERDRRSGKDQIATRINAKDMTPEQKAAYVAAIRKLQTTPYPGNDSLTWYEQFVEWHNMAFSCDLARGPVGAAHNSPLFLPWHREYLRRYENALRQVSNDPSITLPYWDWTDEESTKAVFSDDLMGGEGDPDQGWAVTSGPFAKGTYQLRILDPKVVQDQFAQQTPYIVRRFGAFPDGGQKLPSEADVMAALHVPQYDIPAWDAKADPNKSFRNNLEGWREAKDPDCSDGWQGVSEQHGAPHDMHNAVHVWTGGIWKDDAGTLRAGTMLYNTSSNDPVFFLHHANVDRLWAKWQAEGGHRFPHDAANYGPNDTMWPWFDRSIRSLEDTRSLGYVYSHPTPTTK